MIPSLESAIRKRLKSSKRILALTGAGISAESGVPTFRGEDGLWKNFRAEELATPEAFRKNPKLVWEWYLWRMELISQKEPNPAHKVLAELEEKLSGFRLVTQNVDGLHRKAGSKRLLEIHGNIFRNRCISCNHRGETILPMREFPPLCDYCGGSLRPGVLWFGESYDENLLNESIKYAESAEVTLVIGSSGMVGIPVELARIARENGSLVIEINTEESEYSRHADLFLQGKAGEILPALASYFA
ncbi:NAD-dependent deacylase [Leptospira wolffii]|uniref:SIR2 family NAD-dependent protein deacylase n=1 Tax=Leptospira wolffii TaxID=409998 RepID=UPI001082E2C4|nr:NAD-dependent deacylase [Leptospira wolffii]TGK59947.1 NAD-dependent deacylase [Leptospira wolffii]TGK67597.1 NAD-dependent deacylase [Leptospira wolffii]TGK75955.1 NAD-dependent deacylase [Leptospira wolffii]TGL30206.1 NAD-dependent deacylase [Leptospira wolffii]